MLELICHWRSRALAVVGAGLLANAMAVSADTTPSARDLVEQVMSGTVEELESNIDSIRDDPERLNEIVERLIIPHFDFERMSRRVLGKKRWKGATEDQQTRFVSAFRTMLVRTYAELLNTYDGQTLSYLDPVPLKKEGEVVVPVQVGHTSGKQARVGYAMHQSATGWKVFDVAIDGVSLVKNFRSSFRSMIARDGIDGLISSIENKNSERDS